MILKTVLLFSSTLFFFVSVSITTCPVSNYRELQGRISSPGFGTSGSYGENMSCTYNINLPPGRRIILELTTFSVLGTMPDCNEDSLEIIVGCNYEKYSIGKFCSCSNVSMPMVYSYDNCMTLVFKSDGSKKGAGFEAEYSSADNNETKLDPTQNCSNKLIKEFNGTVFTPNWPLNFPSLISCRWLFDIPEAKVVRIFFTSFAVDPSALCDKDRPSFSGDDIRISGTTTAGEHVFIEKRLCKMPDPAFFAVRDMQTVQVEFGSSPLGEYSGVILGYATYNEGTLDSGMAGCEEIGPSTTETGRTEPPKSTSMPTTRVPTTRVPYGTAIPTTRAPHGLSVLGILIWYIFCG